MLAVLLAWSNKKRRSCHTILLSQILPILISTLLSIKRNQLTVDDAQFAIIQTRSPVMVYILFDNFLSFLHHSTWKQNLRLSLFDRAAAIFLIALCLVINFVIQFSNALYLAPEIPRGFLSEFPRKYQIYVGVALAGSSIGTYMAVLYRHREERRYALGSIAGKWRADSVTLPQLTTDMIRC